ncbi:hypothetical protein L596_025668 [Steinernema carpocapsae]|uniref:Uncharacterized protein n=1 Tax=Steinernema carpocapsae TaxID=34508 RepID=A0A4U5M8F3_STECR|nr:hypothetical protein L596_025668 [Steinernema carpocapsae]
MSFSALSAEQKFPQSFCILLLAHLKTFNSHRTLHFAHTHKYPRHTAPNHLIFRIDRHKTQFAIVPPDVLVKHSFFPFVWMLSH